jgi:hypothetical protein
MLQLLLLLAQAPTQSVERFRVHEPNVRLLTSSAASLVEAVADTDAEEGGSEEGGILCLDDWRQQCRADDDAEELSCADDASWNFEDDEYEKDRGENRYGPEEDEIEVLEDELENHGTVHSVCILKLHR